MSQVVRCDVCATVSSEIKDFVAVGYAPTTLWGPFMDRHADSALVEHVDVCSVACAMTWFQAQLGPLLPGASGTPGEGQGRR